MIHRAGAGPEPIPQKQLNVESLKAAIEFAISPSAKAAAQRMAQQIQSEVFICTVQYILDPNMTRCRRMEYSKAWIAFISIYHSRICDAT